MIFKTGFFEIVKPQSLTSEQTDKIKAKLKDYFSDIPRLVQDKPKFEAMC